VGKLVYVCSTNRSWRDVSVSLATLLVKYDVYEEGVEKMGPPFHVLIQIRNGILIRIASILVLHDERIKGLKMVARR